MNMSIQFPKLGLNLEYVPKSIVFGNFEITIYGILIAVGMLLGLLVILPEGKRNKQNTNDLLGMLITALICGIIGARFSYVLFSMPLYRYNPMDILNLRQGGMTFYGGLFGGIFGGVAYSVIRDVSFGALADTAVSGLLTAQMIGRWGDFFSRGSFGEYTDWAVGMQLPLEAVRADEVSGSLRENLITQGGTAFIQAHPVFLYESLWCLLLLIFFLIRRRKKLFDGEIFLKYLVWYSFGRFFFDLLRTDRFLIPGIDFPASSIVSALLFFVCGLMLLIRQSIARKRNRIQKRRKEEFQAAMEQAEAEVEKIGLEGVMAELAEANRTVPDDTSGDPKASQMSEEPEDSQTEKEPERAQAQIEPEASRMSEGLKESQEQESTEDSQTPEEPDGLQMPETPENFIMPEEPKVLDGLEIQPETGDQKEDTSEDSGYTEAIDRALEDLEDPGKVVIPQMPEIRIREPEADENTDKSGQNPPNGVAF